MGNFTHKYLFIVIICVISGILGYIVGSVEYDSEVCFNFFFFFQNVRLPLKNENNENFLV